MHYNQLNEYMNCRKSISDNVKVGMTGTMFVGSDRYAIVVTEVMTPKKIRICRMTDDDYKSEKIKDENGVEHLSSAAMKNYFDFSEDFKSMVPVGFIYTYRKNNRWMRMGDDMWGTCSVHIGYADNYLDPDF